MDKPIIFYGAGRHAERHLDMWCESGIRPVCFADIDKEKHFKQIFCPAADMSVDILPLDTALERFPDAIVAITLIDPSCVAEYLLSSGISESKLFVIECGVLCPCYGIPKHCSAIGRDFVIDGLHIAACCQPGHAFALQSTGSIERDVKQYYDYCNQLRDDLNAGKPTKCSGCPLLREGASYDTPSIKMINISSGLPGATVCNFKCIYCTYKFDALAAGIRNVSHNIRDVLEYMASTHCLETINYAAGEITVSPHRKEILALWKQNKLRGNIFTNAADI